MEQNRRHQKLLQEQADKFKTELTNHKNLSTPSQNLFQSPPQNPYPQICDTSKLSKTTTSHSSLLPPKISKNWDKSHFKSLLEKQQQSIK